MRSSGGERERAAKEDLISVLRYKVTAEGLIRAVVASVSGTTRSPIGKRWGLQLRVGS